MLTLPLTLAFASVLLVPGMYQTPAPGGADGKEAREVLAAIQKRWAEAAALRVVVDNYTVCAQIRASRPFRVHAEIQKKSEGVAVEGPLDFVLLCDAETVQELEVQGRKLLTEPFHSKRGLGSLITPLSYCAIPYLAGPGEQEYWDRLLADARLDQARFLQNEEPAHGVREILVPLEGSYFRELRIFIDEAGRAVHIWRVIGTNPQGLNYGPYWSLKGLELLPAPLPEADFQLELPADTVELPYEAFYMPRVGERAPSFKLESLEGKAFDLSEACAGSKRVLLQFWGSWCGPCLREMPHIEELHKQYSLRGLTVFGVACDDTEVNARAAARKAKVTFPVGLDGEDIRVQNSFGIRAFPTLMLLDSEGRVIWHSHDTSGLELEALLEEQLE